MRCEHSSDEKRWWMRNAQGALLYIGIKCWERSSILVSLLCRRLRNMLLVDDYSDFDAQSTRLLCNCAASQCAINQINDPVRLCCCYLLHICLLLLCSASWRLPLLRLSKLIWKITLHSAENGIGSLFSFVDQHHHQVDPKQFQESSKFLY
mmetsp:Transcript_26362/g.39679  ORF Transcript_26362/g.39679 Transcript_26362/m.39679 type:complete len:151 (-) Transcript_26362:49-501(-)